MANRFPEIFCDMDGVLVDFLGGTAAVFGTHFDDPALGCKVHRWSVLTEVPEFWLNLPWLAGSEALWRRIEKYTPHILSVCPPEMDTCPLEKRQWCVRHLGISVDRVITCWDRTEKQRFAVGEHGESLLIDDHEDNIAEWRAAGGIGVHFTTLADALQQLTDLGIE